uniref:Uncharacterized protein n=1 Tax=Octopus bimaculoides TaxID=37653 RepID=A0A0L8HZ25_OCTBM
MKLKPQQESQFAVGLLITILWYLPNKKSISISKMLSVAEVFLVRLVNEVRG